MTRRSGSNEGRCSLIRGDRRELGEEARKNNPFAARYRVAAALGVILRSPSGRCPMSRKFFVVLIVIGLMCLFYFMSDWYDQWLGVPYEPLKR
jgi:hypothetical protein